MSRNIGSLIKKRILHAIDDELTKGMTKSGNQIYLLIFLKRKVNQFNWMGLWLGMGMEPLFMGRTTNNRHIIYRRYSFY
jgi:hypothetical protein